MWALPFNLFAKFRADPARGGVSSSSAPGARRSLFRGGPLLVWALPWALLAAPGCADSPSDPGADPAPAQLVDPTTTPEGELLPLAGDTVLRVHYPKDPGFGQLAVRGSVAPLSWMSGQVMRRVDSTTYQVKIGRAHV